MFVENLAMYFQLVFLVLVFIGSACHFVEMFSSFSFLANSYSKWASLLLGIRLDTSWSP